MRTLIRNGTVDNAEATTRADAVVDAKLEPWAQTVSHLLSPEGILVGIVYTPWMHKKGEE